MLPQTAWLLMNSQATWKGLRKGFYCPKLTDYMKNKIYDAMKMIGEVMSIAVPYSVGHPIFWAKFVCYIQDLIRPVYWLFVPYIDCYICIVILITNLLCAAKQKKGGGGGFGWSVVWYSRFGKGKHGKKKRKRLQLQQTMGSKEDMDSLSARTQRKPSVKWKWRNSARFYTNGRPRWQNV